jgi:hypothetical protein
LRAILEITLGLKDNVAMGVEKSARELVEVHVEGSFSVIEGVLDVDIPDLGEVLSRVGLNT